MSSLPWPSFWADVPERDRSPIRDVLADLLRHGVILGDEGSGRDSYLLVRDQYPDHIRDYLSPLGLELIIDHEPPLIQARPVPEECQLLATFTKDETLLVLALWRIYDESRSEQASETVIISANDLWVKWRVFFENIEPPGITALEELLSRLRRKKLIRFQRAEDSARPGEAMIEVLPSLSRSIPFDSIEAWLERAKLYEPEQAAAAQAPEESPQP
ncbi:MAG: DUF4194 domain-containing protein [Verrucomicrobiota bacterium]